jgi:hypothetical protein
MARTHNDPIIALCDLAEASGDRFQAVELSATYGSAVRLWVDLGAIEPSAPIRTVTCRACDGDHPATVEFDPVNRRHSYFCPEAALVTVDDADLATLRFNPDWLVDWLVSALAMPSPVRRRALLPRRVWHLGDVPCGSTLVTIVLARRISNQAALDELASVLGPIHVANKGLVITTSSQVARQVQIPHGFTFLDLRDIIRMVGRRPQLDQTKLTSLVRGVRKNHRRQPGRLDYRQADKPLVDQMHGMILDEKASNPTDAARAIARHAAGGGTEASKVARLVMRYRELPSTN